MSTPNILYIHSHDTGRFIQPYGYAIPTPNLQRFAEQSVLFRRTFCANPTCSPSRAALLTGQSPHSSGMLGLAHRGFGLNDYSQHLLHTLRKAGYITALSGTQHVARNGDTSLLQYDEILDEGRDRIDAVADFLKQRDTKRPFFLSVGFQETHRAYPEPGPEDDPRYVQPPPPFPDTPETRYDMASFRTLARQLDAKMGRVFDLIDEHGLTDNTLVICTTDHGIAFPRMKCNLYDTGIGVMLMMRWPNGEAHGFRAGRVVDALVSQIDVFPTLCGVLGIELPQWLEGKSLMPVLRDETPEVNDEIFAEVTFHAAYEPQRCVRTNRWKYIRRYTESDKPVLPNCDDSPSKTLWMEHGWKNRPVAREQLYDLVFDPHEANNLAADPDHAEVLDEMRERLDRWMERTNDPLRKGWVDPPTGAQLNDPTGVSPSEPPFVVE